VRNALLYVFAFVVAALAFGGASASASKPENKFLFQANTSGTYSWTVPKGVKLVTLDLFGAAGGGSAVAAGGLGGEATATLNVSPGQVFEIVVGGKGDSTSCFGCASAGGFNGGGIGFGGGGGGATDVRSGTCAATSTCDLIDRFVVAGGGGGADFDSPDAGGTGGGSVGGDGDGPFPGHGGTQTSGGAGANAGSFGGGGNTVSATGGGGGAGWFGGGAGLIGGGGGGGGYITPIALSRALQTGVQSGDGTIVITKA
jgi:hypothetical protein